MSPGGQMPPLAPSSTRPQSPYKHTHKTPSAPRGTTPTSECAPGGHSWNLSLCWLPPEPYPLGQDWLPESAGWEAMAGRHPGIPARPSEMAP